MNPEPIYLPASLICEPNETLDTFKMLQKGPRDCHADFCHDSEKIRKGW